MSTINRIANTANQLVRIRELHFSRGPSKIFDGLSIEVRRGCITGLMGPSGTGKTTLLKIMGGQIRPSRGSVWIDAQNVHELNRSQLYALRKRMGMMFQSGALLTDLNVFENVAFPLREHTRLPEQLISNLVLIKLEAVGLRGARALMPGELSGGMARRVALARAIILDPMMIMYDEPFTGLDPITRSTIVKLIKQLNDTLGLTSIVVSHDVDETMAIADYIYILSEGRAIESGTPDELRNSESAWVRQFLQGVPDGPVPFHYPSVEFSEDLMIDR